MRQRLFGLLGILGFAFALAFSVTVTQSVTAPKVAGACGWYVSHYGNTAATQTYDNSQGRYTYVRFQAQVETDGCGNWLARQHVWTDDGSAVYVYSDVREWLNGTYMGGRVTSGTTSNGYFYGLQYFGSSLGADNLNSTASNASFAPNPVGGYTSA